MTTRVDEFSMAFVLIPDADVTQTHVNLSTSRIKTEAPLLEGKRLLEVWTPIDVIFLPFTLLTPQEAREAVADAADDGEVQAPWWRTIFGIFGS